MKKYLVALMLLAVASMPFLAKAQTINDALGSRGASTVTAPAITDDQTTIAQLEAIIQSLVKQINAIMSRRGAGRGSRCISGPGCVTNQPSISISSPSAGANVSWQRNTVQTWTWRTVRSTMDQVINNVDLYLYSNDDMGGQVAFATNYPNSGTFSWNVGMAYTEWGKNISDGVYTIMVCPSGKELGPLCGSFKVNIYSNAQQPSITITSPTGGEQWQRGTTHNITWTNTGSIPTVNVGLFEGANRSWLAYQIPNTGSYSWTVPSNQLAANDYAIGVNSTVLANGDYTKNTFSITDPNATSQGNSTVTVTSPNGGETWTKGQPATITWARTGDAAKATNAQLTIAVADVPVAGYNLVTIPNTGTYTFTVPATFSAGNRYKIWVGVPYYATGQSGNTFTNPGDGSNGDFNVVEPALDLSQVRTQISGACNSTNNGKTLSALDTSVSVNLCSSGSLTGVNTTDVGWSWICLGSNGGSTAQCSATQYVSPTRLQTYGTCNSAINGKTISDAPTSANMCSAGNPGGLTQTATGWSWSCTGSSATLTSGCSATKQATVSNLSIANLQINGGTSLTIGNNPMITWSYSGLSTGDSQAVNIQFYSLYDPNPSIPKFIFQNVTPTLNGSNGVWSWRAGSTAGSDILLPGTYAMKVCPANTTSQTNCSNMVTFTLINPGSISRTNSSLDQMANVLSSIQAIINALR